jgi:hypothetical protein
MVRVFSRIAKRPTPAGVSGGLLQFTMNAIPATTRTVARDEGDEAYRLGTHGSPVKLTVK